MKSSHALGKEQAVLRVIEDPTLFAQVMLGHNVWAKQNEILQSVANHARTAVKACHSSSKTFCAAEAVLWWITSHKEAIAVTTAPTWTQVERVLWGEIRGAVLRARIKYPKPTATSLQLGPGRYAIGLSTNEGVRFQGFHGNVLVVLDEAPGILPEIYEAVDGIRAGGDVRVLALGNPTIASGPFYDAFTCNRESWNLITISAFDTPNLAGLTVETLLQLTEEQLDQDVCPYLTTRRWVKEKYHEWGPGHPLWESRVLGNFPSQSEDALLSLAWLEAAKYREGPDSGVFHAGLDVAGPGEDETVLCVRRGPRIVLLKAWAGQDPRGDVIAALLPFKDRLKTVNVDCVGIGYYMAKHIKDQRFPVQEVNVGERPRDSEKYYNLKAELYWALRQRAQGNDLAGLTDERAIAQLAGIRYSHNSRGQIVIESKEDARKRGVRSPDRAEAIMLAFVDLGPMCGLLEYLRQEIGAMGAANAPPIRTPVAYPDRCTGCGNPSLTKYHASWKCDECNATGQALEAAEQRCPGCESSAICRIGTGWRCNQCGRQFGEEANSAKSLSRAEIMRGMGMFGIGMSGDPKTADGKGASR
jgi:phage terminase large subunit